MFEVPLRPSSTTEQVCGAKHDGVMRFHPSLELELTIHLLYPLSGCAFGEQGRSTAFAPQCLVCRLPRAQGMTRLALASITEKEKACWILLQQAFL